MKGRESERVKEGSDGKMGRVSGWKGLEN